jgi:hypothetical protein
MVLVPRPVSHPCGMHYPIAVGTPTCTCGLLAIGQCLHCLMWVCHIHGAVSPLGRLMCGLHFPADVTEANRRAAVEEERTRPAREAAAAVEQARLVEARAQRAQPFLEISDPVEQLVRTVCAAVVVWENRREKPPKINVSQELLDDVLPAISRHAAFRDITAPVPWDSATVASWFVEQAVVRGVEPTGVARGPDRRGMLGIGSKHRTSIRGWRLANGANQFSTYVFYGDTQRTWPDIFIDSSGVLVGAQTMSVFGLIRAGEALGV